MSKIDADSQEAIRDINNVIGTQYNFNNVVMELATEDDPDKFDIRIKELDHVNYLTQLEEQMSAKNLVPREIFISSLADAVEQQGEVLLIGQPGTGKTVILNELAVGRNAEYISLKGKSLDRVIKYLIKSYGLPIKDQRRSELLDLLESFLHSNPKYFLIDDCESSPDIVNVFLNIEKSKSKFIYASRTRDVARSKCIETVDVPKFRREEIEKFLELEQITLDELRTNELIAVSEGNPLYLYYFSKHQITPLPKGLYDYQETLWRNLSDDQREILLCIATSYFPIQFKVLKNAYETICDCSISPMQFNTTLSDIGYLCKSNNRKFDIFHLSFKEYIMNQIEELDMNEYYVEVVGDAYFEEEYYIDATILLIDLLDSKIKPHIFESAHILFHRGFIDISYNLLSNAIRIFDESRELFEIGYSHYHLSNISREITSEGLVSDGHIEKAIEIFEMLEERKFLHGALTFKAMNLAESGKKTESLALVDRILVNMPDDKLAQAFALVNLSKLYLDFNQYHKGAEFAKKALELFVKLDDTHGIQISILNLSGCLSNINEEELAVDYLVDLLGSDQIKLSPRVKAGVLNNLTSCYRKKGNHEKAKEYCRESIQIGQQLGLDKLVAMNMLNLGNIYRDEEDYYECEKIYLQAIQIAEDCRATKDIGRGYELMANIYVEMERHEDAIQMAEKAIQASTLIQDSFRIAEAYYEKAKAELSLNKPDIAIEDLSRAVDRYLEEGFVDEAIFSLMKGIDIAKENSIILARMELLKKLKKLINSGIGYCPNECITNLNRFEDAFEIEECLKLYEAIIKMSLSNSMNLSAYSFIDFIDFCERHRLEGGKEYFNRVLMIVIDSVSISKRYVGLLAVALDLSRNLLSFDDVESLVKEFVDHFQGYYYREFNGGDALFTLCWENGVIIELHSIKKILVEHKAAIALSILLLNSMSQITNEISEFRVKNIRIFSFDFDSYNQEFDNIDKAMFDPRPVILPQLIGEGKPIVYILAYDYEDRKNAFLWLIMQIYLSMISVFEDISIEDTDKAYAKKVTKLVKNMVLNIDQSLPDDWKVQIEWE